MVAEKLCLTLSSFETNVRESFQLMREENSHCDVTLASEDGHAVSAHRVILAAGSDFFRGIFQQAQPKDLFLYLKGVKKQELDHIVDFLYNGQAYLVRDELKKFLVTARELKIKGLEDDTNEICNDGEESIPVKLEDKISEKEIIASSKSFPLQISRRSGTEEKPVSMETEYGVVREGDAIVRPGDLNLEAIMERIEMMDNGLQWVCRVCGKTGQSSKLNF